MAAAAAAAMPSPLLLHVAEAEQQLQLQLLRQQAQARGLSVHQQQHQHLAQAAWFLLHVMLATADKQRHSPVSAPNQCEPAAASAPRTSRLVPAACDACYR
eukprot:1158705-Pelagomonas_calceolata.AAC.6